ncbi:hypothetical protein MUK42_28500 [Musa troglodytarum]|uniref:Uncharacterized protein n=1 Tax=Musa troglodytarum TaxID=320322 RepID=A0A9E7G5S1_9LILI|nr:hypothetical protein MUK42_28500 [Musa troglodytarum]
MVASVSLTLNKAIRTFLVFFHLPTNLTIPKQRKGETRGRDLGEICAGQLKLSETAATPCVPLQEDKAQVKRAPSVRTTMFMATTFETRNTLI